MKIQDRFKTSSDVEGSNLTVKGKEVGERVFSSFRPQVSADINTVDIDVKSSSIVRVDGTTLTPEEQLHVLASYQTAQLDRNVGKVVSSVERFLSDPNFKVNTRYVPANVDPNEKAREWTKTSLYHGLCGIGTSFQHDGINYRVITSTQSYSITGLAASKIINGSSSVNLKGLSGDIITPTRDLSIIIDTNRLAVAMNEVINQLQVTISGGKLFLRGECVREWLQHETISVEASNHRLSDVSINI